MSSNFDGVESVARWTKALNKEPSLEKGMFSKRLVSITIFQRSHWTMCVIDNNTFTIEYYDSFGHGKNEAVIVRKFSESQWTVKMGTSPFPIYTLKNAVKPFYLIQVKK